MTKELRIEVPDDIIDKISPTLKNKETFTLEDLEAQLPKPTGYRILIALPDVDDFYRGTSLIKTENDKHREYITSIMGLVLDTGPEAYADKKRYPAGPWCKPGDYVMFRMNTGTRFKIGSKEFRLMNDDSVEAVIGDPRGICSV
tara:strand:+ start:5152 stop:5583 length:432 start_codon:yes stop_codon:yes gene_type:complete